MNVSIPDNRCWALIDLDIIQQNVKSLLRRIPNTSDLMAVVKADGYGHGILPVAQACVQAGAKWLGTATLAEALTLRENGLAVPILVFGVTPPQCAQTLANYQLTQVVPSLEYAEQLAQHLCPASSPLSVHLGVDTGMGRLGWWLQPDTIPTVCGDIQKICQLPSLRAEGIMTQLSSARGTDPDAISYTEHQLRLFSQLCEALTAQGITFRYQHVLNSGGIIHHSSTRSDIVRIGHLLYEPLPGSGHIGLRPAMELRATIAYVKTLPAGACIGYGRTYQLPYPARIAVVNIGHCDGYPSLLSNRGIMLLHGRRVPVVGEVCMDQTMLDVSEVPEAAPGDIVTIVGQDGDDLLTTEDIDHQAGSLPDGPLSVYFTNRMTRCCKHGGRIINDTLMPLAEKESEE